MENKKRISININFNILHFFAAVVILMLLGYALFFEGKEAFFNLLFALGKWWLIIVGVQIVIYGAWYLFSDYDGSGVLFGIIGVVLYPIVWICEKMQNKIWGEYKDEE